VRELHASSIVRPPCGGAERGLEGAARDRDVLGVVLIDRDALGGRGHVDRRRPVFEDDRLVHRRRRVDLLEHRHRLVDADPDAAALDLDVAEEERHQVLPGRRGRTTR
jgi:hypothetical protein